MCTQLCVHSCVYINVYSVNYCTVQFRQILLIAQEASYEMSSLRAKHFFSSEKWSSASLIILRYMFIIFICILATSCS